MARPLADENFPLPVVEELRALGHDVLTISEQGKAGQGVSDAEVLEDACVDRRAVLTLNRKHFIQLHRQRADHGGIIVCTSDRDLTAQAKRIHVSIDNALNLPGKLIRVNRPGPDEPKGAAGETVC